MAASFGVHFGATCACIATSRDGKVDVIANDSGDRTTPAIVAFTDHDQAVGLAAKQGLIRNAQNTVCRVKHLLGVSFDSPQVKDATSTLPVKIINKDGQPRYQVNYKEKLSTFSPALVASTVFKKMMETAESAGGQADSHDAVITVPLHFGEQQIKTTCEAATHAGFKVLRVISEPVAAALAYGIGQEDVTESCNVLVFRLGGCSLDATVLNVNSGMFRVLATVTDSKLGGNKINDILVNYFADEFKRKWKMDPLENKRSVAKLRSACENCKHVLSTMPSAHCSVDSLYEGIDLSTNISRARFDGLCSAFFQKCLQPIDEALKMAGLQKGDIQKVVLSGGTSRVPALQSLIKQHVGAAAALLSGLLPDELIAAGAAQQAAILCGNEESEMERNAKSTEVPCLSASIFVQTACAEERFDCVLPAMTPLPVRRHRKYVLQPEQTSFSLLVVYREAEGEEQPLAKLVMKDLPAGSLVNAVFHLRSDGNLHVTCTEPTSNKSTDVTLETSS